MGKRREYRRMMKALADLDRVDAGKAPKRELRPEVRHATNLWVHGNTAKVSGTWAKVTDLEDVRRSRRRRWPIVLLVVVVIAGAIAAIPVTRHAVARLWSSAVGTPHRLLPPVVPTTHGPYTFDYTINPDLAPPGTDGVVQSAVDEISALTGLAFHYVGVTHKPVHYIQELPPGAIVGDYPPLEVAWSSPAEFAKLNGDVVGFGGSTYIRKQGHEAVYVTGAVALRSDRLAEEMKGPGGRAAIRSVVLHELGHVVGLGHVNDPRELMYPEMTKLRDFGPGDREGLALLGQRPCAG
jgi:hypothetical protein